MIYMYYIVSHAIPILYTIYISGVGDRSGKLCKVRALPTNGLLFEKSFWLGDGIKLHTDCGPYYDTCISNMQTK